MSGFTLDDVRDSFGDDIGEQLQAATAALSRLAEEHAARIRIAQGEESASWSELGRAAAVFAANSEANALSTQAALGWSVEQLSARASSLCGPTFEPSPLEQAIVASMPTLVERLGKILEAVLAEPQRKTQRTSKSLAKGLAELEELGADRHGSGAEGAEFAAADALDSEAGDSSFEFGEEPETAVDSEGPATRSLDEILEALRNESEAPAVWARIEGAPDPLDQLVHAFHAVAGTSSLIGLDALTDPARRMEEICERALEERQNPVDQAKCLHRGWTLLGEFGFGELEPSGSPEELQNALGLLLAEPDTDSVDEQVIVFGSEAPEEPEEFAFERPREPEPIDPDMLEIFREEATEVAGRVRFTLAALESSPQSIADVHELERAFHQLKGASAMIGLDAVAAKAFEQEREYADLFEAQLLPDEVQVLAARAAMEWTLEQVGLDAATLLALPVEEEDAFQFDSEPLQPEDINPDSVWTRMPVEVLTDEELIGAFREEAEVLCDGMAHSVVALEEGPASAELVGDLMRQVHTLKGALNTVGLDPLGQVLHEVETVLEGIEAEPAAVQPKTIAAMADWSLGLVRAGMTNFHTGSVLTAPNWVADQTRALLGGAGFELPTELAPELDSDSEEPAEEQTETSRFVRVAAGRLDGLMDLAGELVVARSRMNRRVQQLESFQDSLGSARKRLLETVVDFVDQYEFAGLSGQSYSNRVVGAGVGVAGDGTSDWSPSESADSALASSVESMFSEIELDRYEDVNILARTLREIGDDIVEVSTQISGELALFREESDVFSGLVSGLQTEVTQARMVPIEQLFLRLRSPIRDAATREGKSVAVRVTGESVTIDKTLIDELYTPLLHLVRNSVSHGIESAEARRSAGKEMTGEVRLTARQRSGQILLEVSDDGGGLNLEALRAKGVAAGIVEADTALDDPRIPELIFSSGLSTRDEVSDVAGRGVGCDVLRREVERMNGHVIVETRPGQGTTFRITLPNTLAIYRALMVRQDDSTFAVPLAFAERVLDLRELVIEENGGSRRVQVGEECLPLHSLATLFGKKAEPAWTRRDVVLLRLGDQGLLLDVDDVLGQGEIVVKSLGDILSQHPLFSGMTLTSEGGTQLILDVPGLFDTVSEGRFGVVLGPESGASTEGASEEERVAEAPVPSVRRQVEVLYVDDSLSVRKAAEKFLRGAGASVTVAVDGQDAIEKLRTGSFDLIFTDLEMPRMHGYDLIREIRFVPAYSDLPVIVVTSRSAEKHRNQAKKLGASDYVTKPFNQDVLDEKLRAHLPVQLEAGRLVLERRKTPRD